MKRLMLSAITIIAVFVCLSTRFAHAESCDIEKIIGAQVSPGTYKVNVKRESSNMYKVTGQEIYIKTRMCLNLALMDDAILEIKSSSGDFIYGEIHFLN